MTKRPPQGRGSGGRVTPSVKATEAAAAKAAAEAAEARTGKGRLLRSSKGRSAAAPAPATGRAPAAKGATKGAATSGTKGGAKAAAGVVERDTDAAAVASGDGATAVWGMGDMFLWWFLSLVASVVGYVLISGAFVATGDYVQFWPNAEGWPVGEVAGRIGLGQEPTVTIGINGAPLWLQVLLQVPLWATLVAGPAFVAARKGLSWKRDYGWGFRWADAPVGLAIGVASQLLLVPAIYWVLFKLVGEQDVSANARALTSRADDPLGVLALVVIVGVGAPIAEEIFYRGLSQHAIAKRFGPRVAVLGGAVFFAAAHLQVLEFLGLFAFGLVLGVLTRRAGRIGPAVCAHVGFNLTAAAVLLLEIPLA